MWFTAGDELDTFLAALVGPKVHLHSPSIEDNLTPQVVGEGRHPRRHQQFLLQTDILATGSRQVAIWRQNDWSRLGVTERIRTRQLNNGDAIRAIRVAGDDPRLAPTILKVLRNSDKEHDVFIVPGELQTRRDRPYLCRHILHHLTATVRRVAKEKE